MAASSPEDPFSGLPELRDYADNLNKLDLEDKKTISKKALTDLNFESEFY